MKLKFLYLMTFFSIISLHAQNSTSASDYFKEFKKNEQPQNIIFKNLKENSNAEKGNFYVIYKSNIIGEQYYFKIQFNKNNKIVSSSYSIKSGNINNQLIIKLNKISEDLLKNYDEIITNMAIRSCNRNNGCYGKADDEAVLVCTVNCMLENK